MVARLFSHRCTQNVDGAGKAVNTIKACRMALTHGYEGIEVDFQYHNGSFYMDHDHYYLTNETMDMLFTALSDLTYSIWIDLKTTRSTSNNGQLQDLYSLLNKHNMVKRSVVELYNTSLSIPKGMETTSCFPGGRGDIVCKRGYEVSIQDRFNPKPLYVWNVTAKDSCNLYYLNEKDVILQDYNVPRLYASCEQGVWIVVGVVGVFFIFCVYTVQMRLALMRKAKVENVRYSMV